MAKGSTISYVKCRVEPGMFRDEWLVHLDALDPKNPRQPTKVQLFVDQREVVEVKGTPKRNEPAPAWLCVALLGVRGNLANIVLPQPATPFGENVLVSSESLQPAPGP